MSINVTFPGGVKVNAHIEPFVISTDQPVKAGGEGSAPAPFTLFLASLATCAGYYVKAFCDSRQLDTTGMHLTMDTVHDPENKIIEKFLIRIHVPAGFPEKYDGALVNAAAVCAVKRHLSEKIMHEIVVVRETWDVGRET
ncbi:MAG: OsmC family protein [bacterium]